MKELFLPYELALIAKEKGFNEQTFACYHTNHVEFFEKNQYIRNSDICSPFISAPLYQQIIDWIRDNHEIYVYIVPYPYENKVCYHITFKDDSGVWADVEVKDIDEAVEESLRLI